MAWWVFQNVVVTAGLALAVAGICRVTRLGPVARHALWLVVLVKFMTPPLVVWPWPAPDPLRIAAVQFADVEPMAGQTWARADPGIPVPAASVPSPARDAIVAAASQGEMATATAAAVWFWFLIAWVAGSVALVAIETSRIVRFSRLVAAGRPAGPALVSRTATLSMRLGLPAMPVRVVGGLSSPAVWCIGRPQILWPEALTSDPPDVCVDGLLLHEIAHVRRRDHLVGWLELAAGLVWWWNPLFWYVRATLREQAELACDATVISTLPDGRRAYAESLLTVSSASRPGQWSLAVVGARAGTRRMLERRLVMIMQGRTPIRLSRLGLCTLALTGTLTLPGWAASQNPPSPPAAVPPTEPQAGRPSMPPPPPPAIAKPAIEKEGVKVQKDVQKPDQPKPVKMPLIAPPAKYTLHLTPKNLPADAQETLTTYGTDVETIQREYEQRLATRRDALVASLEALQVEHTKAGRLDEAVAIRDFLSRGIPLLDGRYALRRVR